MHASQALPIYLDHLRGERRLASKTVEAYERDLAAFFGFLVNHLGVDIELNRFAQLKPTDFRAYMAYRRRGEDGLSSASLARNLTALRSFFRYIARRWDVKVDAIDLIRPPRVGKRLPKPISVSASKDLLSAASTSDKRQWVAARDTAVLTLLYGAGLRISEALSLTGQDFPLGDSLRIKGKGGKIRLVPILPIIQNATELYVRLYPQPIAPDENLFRAVRGGPLGPRPIQAKIHLLRSALGLPDTTTPHALRHSFATHLLASGGDLRTIQELLGHASLSSTQVYTDVDATSLMNIHSAAHPRA